MQFIKRSPLNYPEYEKWLEKCSKELKLRNKRGVYICDNEEVVGGIIFQQHKRDSSALEIKNFRVSAEYRKRGVGSKLLEEAEKYARENGFLVMQIDTHEENHHLIKFLKKRKFYENSRGYLYTTKTLEVILRKKL